MRVFVAGAAGAVGSRLVPQLVARGHEVTASTRSAAKVEQLRGLGAEAVVVDGLDAAGVGEAVAQAEPEVVVHQMTALAGNPDLRRFDRWFAVTNELRTKGTQNLLAAAEAAGVRKLVAQSYTGWTNPRDGGPVKTEADGFDPHPARSQVETMAAIRWLEETVPAAAVEGVVLRYGNFYGPGASESMIDTLRKRRLPIVGGGKGVWSWTHVDDAAAATVAAVERGHRGVYNVVDDDPAPVSEWLPYLAEVLGAKPPLRVPAWLGGLAAGEMVVGWMTSARGASNEKAKRELDWKPAWASWREGFRHGLVEQAGGRRDAAAAG